MALVAERPLSPAPAKESQRRTPARTGYVPAIDGLRGIAVLMVVVFHVQLLGGGGKPSLIGGFIGVDVFFAISGFLITGLLLEEFSRHGDVSLWRFYARRALRLGPALVVVIVATLIATWAVLGSPQYQPTTLAAGFVANWSRAIGFGGVPDSPLGRMGWLSHTWSLSIEEQFYLFWPALMLLALRFRSRLPLLGLAVAIALGAWLLRIGLLDHGSSPDRVYNGTDTRADALMVGCILAIALSKGWLPAAGRAAREFQAGLVPLCAAVLIVIAFRAHYNEATMLKLGYITVSLCSAVLIWGVVAVPKSRAARWLGTPGLVWVGRISYPIYLWHFPVIVFFGAEGWLGVVWPIAVPLTIALAWATYALVERPALGMRRRLRRT